VLHYSRLLNEQALDLTRCRPAGIVLILIKSVIRLPAVKTILGSSIHTGHVQPEKGLSAHDVFIRKR